MRLRMAGTKLSDEETAPNGSSAGASSPAATPSEPVLDDSISAQDASKLKEEGNVLYKAGDYKEAIEKYSSAAKSAHASDDDRAVYLANRAAAYLRLQQFKRVVDDTTDALKLKPGYVKALARRKEAREALKDWRGAYDDAKELKEGHNKLERLRLLADQKEKKDREEAMSALKGLGNSILSNFGMSLDDISMEQDPESGSYNIKMKN